MCHHSDSDPPLQALSGSGLQLTRSSTTTCPGRCRTCLKNRKKVELHVAYDDQRAFAEAYSFSVPVLEMDLDADDPFQFALPGA